MANVEKKARMEQAIKKTAPFLSDFNLSAEIEETEDGLTIVVGDNEPIGMDVIGETTHERGIMGFAYDSYMELCENGGLNPDDPDDKEFIQKYDSIFEVYGYPEG